MPCGFTKAGFNLANLSIGETLIPLSFSITLEVFGTKTLYNINEYNYYT